MRGPTSETLKKALIILCAAAAALGILAYFVVFYPSGSYEPAVIQGDGTTFSTLPTSTTSTATGAGFITLPTSTAENGATGTGSATSTVTATQPGTYATSYAAPYPVTWNEGGVSYAVTAASYANGGLTLTLFIQMGPGGSPCVPDTVRLVTDEMGDQESPSSPAGPNFTFPDTGTCNGTPGATYSESLIFPVAPTIPSPYLLTTGGSANTYFMAATSTDGGVEITLPTTQG